MPNDAYESYPGRTISPWLLRAQAHVPSVNYSDDFGAPVFPSECRENWAKENEKPSLRLASRK